MQIDISFRHMDPSDPLKEYAEEKIRRVIRKHIRDNFDAQVTLSIEKFRHIANFLLSYKGFSIKCEESSEDMYSSIDLALDKLERQIRRYKDKLRKHKPAEGRDRYFNISVIAPGVEEKAPEDDELLSSDDLEAAPEAEDAASESPVRILKRETMAAHRMTIDEALMAIDLEQRPFLVFLNTETNAISVLYRLDDGNFGLIDPST